MSPSPESGSAASAPPSTINVQLLSPSFRDIPDGRLSLTNVDLDIEIGALQQRIVEQLPQSTTPERLRMIYYGRAMTDAKAKLRSYIQRELDSSSVPDTITIHLVISPIQGAQHSSEHGRPGLFAPRDYRQPPHAGPTRPPGLQGSHAEAHGVPPPPFPAMMHGLAQQPQFTPMHQTQSQWLSHQPYQNQLSALQQQMQQLQQNVAVPPGMPFPNLPFPAPPMMPGMPHPMMATWQNIVAQQQQQRAADGANGVPSHGSVPSATATAFETNPTNILGAQAHTVPHSQTNVQEMVGPNGQRMRVTTRVDSMVISRSNTPQPPPSNLQAAGSNESNHHENQSAGLAQPTSTSPASNNSNTQIPRNSTGMPTITPIMPFMSSLPQLRHSMPPPPASNGTTAWLLSGPNGPHAILFSLEHGVYTSQTQPTPTASQARNVQTVQSIVRNRNHRHQTQQQGQTDQAAQPAQPAQPAPVVIRRRAEGQQQNQDLFTLAATRIWLFVRLYLFALMFTQPGSWLRRAIIAGAVIYCVQPPNNFLQNHLQRHYRRLQGHLETLLPLGPPAAGNAQNQNQLQHNNPNQPNTPAQPNTTRREPTPQETARRLLAEHHDRNRAWWTEPLRRVERGVALFLASLVPGVGERHIRARNEAQAAEREERERREREANGQDNIQAEGQGQGQQPAGENGAAIAAAEVEAAAAEQRQDEPQVIQV